jgi:hypothetical protein
METDNTTPFGLEALPGQQILPGFKEAMRVDAHSLKPFDEEFCQLYVELGDTGKAYQQVALKFKDKEVDRLRAQKNASAMLKRPEIIRRVAQYQAVTRAAVQSEVIGFKLSAMRFDPAMMYDEQGCQKKITALDVEQRKCIGLDAKLYDGGVVYVPVFPDKQKESQDLMRMCGLDKQMVELTGKDGGAIKSDTVVTFYIPSNGRD